ncbi:hypothetical protein BKA67DRAFT_109039 [Truncatella angustata]|uniref:Uncharacterized protein n=1 Tax=Truncatella angustata TaxID=152316 RepID=A0A9P8RJJ7_9PEZI|nr:uncharacterized protein BKA67DRAFT_109039 [Truncatella angustata]KAH6645271.1 hypothetical protein BKA67DRAFT_109039 [Truncatella angustata]
MSFVRLGDSQYCARYLCSIALFMLNFCNALHVYGILDFTPTSRFTLSVADSFVLVTAGMRSITKDKQRCARHLGVAHCKGWARDAVEACQKYPTMLAIFELEQTSHHELP